MFSSSTLAMQIIPFRFQLFLPRSYHPGTFRGIQAFRTIQTGSGALLKSQKQFLENEDIHFDFLLHILQQYLMVLKQQLFSFVMSAQIVLP